MEREEILAVYEAGPEAVINLIEQLTAIIAELEERVKSLEERINKNSHNSSKPPPLTDAYASQKPKPKSRRINSSKKVGGQKGHSGTTLRMIDNPDETVIHNVNECSSCHTSLEHEEAKDYEIRQSFDIPPVRLFSTEHRAEIKPCPKCGHINKAEFPNDVTQPVQYGPRVRAFAVYLHDYQLIPYDRGCELLSDVYGCEISSATLIRAENECFEGVEKFENVIKDTSLQSPVINCDETQETSDSLTTEQIKDFETMYDNITKMGLEENPPPLDLDTQPKKRGRKKQTKPKNLLDRLVDYKGDILRFMYDFEVPFDNNQAERDVRMMKVQQKISGTYRSVQGARSFCRIRGYISTIRKNMLSVIDAIGAVFNGKPFISFMDSV